MPRVERHLRKNGGPVLMVQLEHEYGRRGVDLVAGGCDRDYVQALRDAPVGFPCQSQRRPVSVLI